ncbi:MAG TPA: hypothetical protein VFE51_31795 [Verrucomicrobiae bacterium]|nr:hypothetical protein [Verrucomicrobiae bacterium]
MNANYPAQSGRYEARILAVLLLLLIVTLALLSDEFRREGGCGWTVGQPSATGQAHRICDWFGVR